MPYVERKNGAIVGVYGVAQPEYAEEWLEPDHADVVAYLNPPPAVPSEISDRQFFQQMAIEGRITQDEALDAVGSGVIPAAMDALVEQLPESQRFAARMLIRGATTFRRTHPVTELIGQLYGMTGDQIDATWRSASEL
ncbi:hypothetical protein [Shinella fusca]|uniref:Uncharacterized protein n=1 Tax=Shinella fusca TaxID=544480 RepID=A0A7W7YR75_9HYPH|nr:hypothetical protein [Shinella fusca]MBB5040692.1 hypothetical protein [Shinella fusca]